MAIVTYDPADFLKSTLRSLVSVVQDASPFDTIENKYVYDVIPEFPPPKMLKEMPLARTVIHFEVDSITQRSLGFGDLVLIGAYSDDPDFPAPAGSIQNYESAWYEINFDIGIWASALSGGTTARLNALALLHSLFKAGAARSRLATMTNGIQAVAWSGGHNVQETVNDIDVFRHVGATLVVRVFSTETATQETEVVEIDQENRSIDLDGTVIVGE